MGIVKTQFAEIGDLRLESGEVLPKVTLAYETYGKLNGRRDNAMANPRSAPLPATRATRAATAQLP